MLAVTALSTYLYCDRKLYLNKVLRIYDPPSAAMSLGTIRHNVYEKVNAAEFAIVCGLNSGLSFEEVLDRYNREIFSIVRQVVISNKNLLSKFGISMIDAYEKNVKFFEIESRRRSLNVFNFMTKSGLSGEELWTNLTPKLESEKRVSNNELNGIIDMIEHHDGYSVPVEFKTGKAPNFGMWPGHKMQLAAYMTMLNADVGYLHYLDTDSKLELKMNPMLKDEVIGLIERVKAMLESKEVPAIIKNENKCNACGIKKQCYDEGFIRMKAVEAK